jgi:hypothetical protein
VEKYRNIDEELMEKDKKPSKAKKKQKTSKKKSKEDLEDEELVKKDPRIERIFYEDVVMTNPKTGEKYTQKIRIVRYKTQFSDRAKSILEEEADDLQRTLDAFNT